MKFLKYFPVPLMIILLMPALPISLPVLQPEAMVRYGQGMRNYGLEGALRWEDGRIHPLPQDYADMVAWEELSDIVIRTYQSLSPVEQESTVIYAENYGEAASIKYYGRRYNLPEPVSFDESFIFWAPDSITLTTLIYVNDDTTDIAFFFREIEPVGRITNPYARETGLPVYLCRGPKNNFEQFYRDKVHDLKSIYR
jgi:hypothetical protein